jgi:uncharacterized protein YbbC (DUF1343 family)
MADGSTPVRTGLDQLTEYLDLVRARRVGTIVNHTSVTTSGEFVTDLLPPLGADLRVIFTPEHGLFGTNEAGKAIASSTHRGVPVVSLYGMKKKPEPADLKDLDLLIYDIQDVACRFYTYITTMAMAMEAAAENNVPFLVLDRPCLRGGLDVSGPILRASCRSFVGYLPIPIAYGMTCGELARMAAGEGWLGDRPVSLSVIPVTRWKRGVPKLPTGSFLPPSPNLPTLQAVVSYPGTCLLEATNLSEGRGTETPFLTLGAPWVDGARLATELKDTPGVTFTPVVFTPRPIPGKALRPKYAGQRCEGVSIAITDPARYQSLRTGLTIIHTVQKLWPEKLTFRDRFFRLLSGTEDMHVRLAAGEKPETILARYDKEVERFRARRARYLLY